MDLQSCENFWHVVLQRYETAQGWARTPIDKVISSRTEKAFFES
jgi:hypothetical protein